MMHRRKSYISGVTLVEVLVAVTILALGIISAAQCMNAAFITNQKAQNMAIATSLAVGRLEEVRQDGYVNTMASTNYTWTNNVGVWNGTAALQTDPNPLLKNNSRTLVTTLSYYNDAANLRTNMMLQVVVTVTWVGAKGKVNNVTLTTLMSDRDKL
ncbi:MAG: prepilin-type N-terminal cleavage/methylation domain-containing protein [bacterium]